MINSIKMEQKFIEICRRGTIFCPATNHYEDDHVRVASVSCDRCGRRNLEACKGIKYEHAYRNIDLCIACVATVQNQHQPTPQFMVSPPNYIPHQRYNVQPTCVTVQRPQTPIIMIYFPR